MYNKRFKFNRFLKALFEIRDFWLLGLHLSPWHTGNFLVEDLDIFLYNVVHIHEWKKVKSSNCIVKNIERILKNVWSQIMPKYKPIIYCTKFFWHWLWEPFRVNKQKSLKARVNHLAWLRGAILYVDHLLSISHNPVPLQY